MKIAVVTDSNSGITQSEANELGIKVVPMPFLIDGKEYFEDINLTQERFYELLEGGAEVSTSQPSPESVMKIWNDVLKEYEQLVYIPMSGGLSGSVQTARLLAEEFDGRVEVADNRRISVTQRDSVKDALELAKRGKNAREIREILEKTGSDSTIYIMLDTLEYLRKGGRVTPAAAALGTIFHIKPVLQIQGGKLDAFAKARTIKQGKAIMLAAIEKDIAERFGDPEGVNTSFCFAHTKNHDAAELFREEAKERFPQGGLMHIDPLSLSVSCHIGPGSIAMAASKRLDYDAFA